MLFAFSKKSALSLLPPQLSFLPAVLPALLFIALFCQKRFNRCFLSCACSPALSVLYCLQFPAQNQNAKNFLRILPLYIFLYDTVPVVLIFYSIT